MPYVAGQTGNEQVTQQVTYPGPPPGFSPLILWGFPEYFTWDPNATVQTVDFTVYMPVQVDTGTLQSLMQDLHDQLLSGFNDDILAYEIDNQPISQISIPSQICIDDPISGSPTCLSVPGQICLPIIGCINLAGSTLEVGEAYRIWMIIGIPPSSAGYRAAVRAQLSVGVIITIITVLIPIIAALAPTIVLDVKNLFSGTTTLATAQQAANTVAGIPGNIVGGAFAGPDTTILILGLGSVAVGVLAIIMGQQPPPSNPVALSGNLSAPGGLGIGGGFSSGGGGATQSRSRR